MQEVARSDQQEEREKEILYGLKVRNDSIFLYEEDKERVRRKQV